MDIYKTEIDDGLKDQIQNSQISIACELFTKDDYIADEHRNLLLRSIAKANPDQRDLFYKHSILASVGWNSNDDVFDRLETWNARSTPVDKQINFMHNELDIIGHSTQSSVYGADGNLIPDNITIEQLPDKFDVITEFVLYQMWDDKARSEMMSKLISEINEGKWFVSMECRFPAFDYAIIDLDGTHKTVARSANTAFLTKHLKAFGGTGEYEGRRVGRLIRNFFFSGQGIVNKPANPRSIIFNNAIAFNSKGSLVINKGNIKMEEELKKQVAELQSKLDKADAEKAKEKEEEMKDAKHKAECAEKAQADLVAKLEKAESDLAVKNSAIETLTAELKASNEKLGVAQAEIEASKKAQAQANRVGKLVAAGLNDEESKATATKWEGLNDSQFDEIVAIYKIKLDAAKASDTKVETKVEADLDKAKAEANANLNTDTGANVEAEMKAIADCIGGAMKFCTQANNKNKTNN